MKVMGLLGMIGTRESGLIAERTLLGEDSAWWRIRIIKELLEHTRRRAEDWVAHHRMKVHSC